MVIGNDGGLCGTTAHVAHKREGDLDEVVAGTGFFEKLQQPGIEQQVQSNDNNQQSGNNPVFVSGGDTDHKVGKILPVFNQQPAHLAEINKTDNIIRQYENIAWMRVRMKKTMNKNLFHDEVSTSFSNKPQIVSLLF